MDRLEGEDSSEGADEGFLIILRRVWNVDCICTNRRRWARTEMMSTAILMAMGAEQSSKQPVAQDVEKLEGPTFAQTLDARVGIAPAISEKDSKIATPPESAKGKTESAAMNLIDVPDFATGAKAKEFVGQATQALGESKNINGGKTEPLRTAIGAAPQVQAKTEDTETQIAELPVNAKEDTVPVEAIPQVTLTANSQTEDVRAQEHQADKNQIQMSSVQTPVVQKEIPATGRTQDAAPTKKTATKKQEGDAMQPVVAAKSGAATVHPIADETKSTHGVVVQASTPIPGQTAAAYVVPVASAVSVAAPNIALNAESDKSGVSSAAASVATADSSGSKNPVHGLETSVPDRETTVAAPGDPTAPAKPDAKGERLQVVATNAGGDSDTKTRLTGESPVATVHAAAPGADATAGAATSIVTGLTKLPGGGGSASTTSLSNRLREQDGSGSVARSTEPMPRTLSATPTALEVGIPDGTHGWLKVRAEMTDGGVVNASVSAASATSQEMLHRELPSLTAYLQSEKVAVNTVVVHPTASAGAESRGTPAGAESGGSGQTPPQSNEGGQQQGSVKAVAGFAEDGTSYLGLHGVEEDGTLPLATYGSGGSWLSVRA
jgi:hypothetical protein